MKYLSRLGAVTLLAVLTLPGQTLDQAEALWKARRFKDLTFETKTFIEEVERVTNARVSLIAKDFGKDAVIIDRRNWR